MDVNFYDKKEFSWSDLIESYTPVIEHELRALIASRGWMDAYPEYIKENNKQKAWRTFNLMFFGIKHLQNINKAPETFRILSQVPGLISAEFSFLPANVHIKPHKGYTRMALRCHLPLIVPEGKLCGLKVEDDIRYWEHGNLIVFDDSKMHEAWNNSTKDRVVLMFDIVNPAWNYNASQICEYKIKNMDDPFLLSIASKEKWMEWYINGSFPLNHSEEIST